ncbi:MAG: C45 family peptidase [Phycisphaerae bacterium]|nr:C45 family peptidase [Phycisphaerae bacterium]
MICISLKGSHYEIGVQHGRTFRDVIHCAIRQVCRFFGPKRRPGPRAVQDRADALKADYPQLLEEMTGIADGAEIPLEDVLILNLGPWSSCCTNIAFYDSDEGPILGHTNDDKPGGHFDAMFSVEISGGQRFLYVGSAGTLGSGAGVNGAGLAVSHANARPQSAEDKRQALNMNLYSRTLLEGCGDATEAERFLTDRTFRSGGDNIIVMDSQGHGFVAEKYPPLVDFRPVDKGALYCTNRTLAPRTRQMMDQDNYEQGAKETIGLVNRERYLVRVIEENQGRFTRELMERTLRSTEEGSKICNAYTNWAAILVPRRTELLLADRFPCHNEFRRYVVER